MTNGGSDAPDASDSDNDEDDKTNDEENRSESPPKPKRKRGRPPKVVRKEEKLGKDRWVRLQILKVELGKKEAEVDGEKNYRFNL